MTDRYNQTYMLGDGMLREICGWKIKIIGAPTSYQDSDTKADYKN